MTYSCSLFYPKVIGLSTLSTFGLQLVGPKVNINVGEAPPIHAFLHTICIATTCNEESRKVDFLLVQQSPHFSQTGREQQLASLGARGTQ